MKCLQTFKHFLRAAHFGAATRGTHALFSNNALTPLSTTMTTTLSCRSSKIQRRSQSTFQVDDDVFGLTDDERQFRRMVSQFAEKELDPQTTYEIDKTNSFPGFRDFVKKCGELGLLGITCPAEYGGSEGSYMMQVLIFFFGLLRRLFLCAFVKLICLFPRSSALNYSMRCFKLAHACTHIHTYPFLL